MKLVNCDYELIMNIIILIKMSYHACTINIRDKLEYGSDHTFHFNFKKDFIFREIFIKTLVPNITRNAILANHASENQYQSKTSLSNFLFIYN